MQAPPSDAVPDPSLSGETATPSATDSMATSVTATSAEVGGPGADPAHSTAHRLRQIATELFAERGYAGTSLAEIASRLGIRKPSLYNYYRSKDELFLELFETSLGRWRQVSRPPLEAALEHGPEAGDSRFWQRALYRHLKNTTEFGSESPHDLGLCRVAVGQVTGETETRVHELLERARQDFQLLIERIFRSAIEAGEVIDRPPSLLGYSWKTFIDGVVTHQIFVPAKHRDVYVDRVDELWSLYWRGIARHPDEPAVVDTPSAEATGEIEAGTEVGS